MADPTPYARGYSFTGFQSGNPTSPLPGQKVDADLDSIATAVAALVNAVKDIRRSDGALKNGVVTSDSLAPGVLPNPTAYSSLGAAVDAVLAAGTNIIDVPVTVSGVLESLRQHIADRALKASPTFTGTVGLANLNVTGGQDIDRGLQAQPGNIRMSSYLSAPSESETQMEFMDSAELYANTGGSLSKLDPENYKRSKVALYRSVIAGVGGGDAYAANFVSVSNVGHSGNNMTLELDNNSYSGNAAVTFDQLMAGLNVHCLSYAAGVTSPGQVISGVHLVNLTASMLRPARVFGTYNGKVYGHLYDDDCTADGAVLRSKGTKSHGFDFEGSLFTSGYFGRSPNNHAMAWRNASNTADVPAVLVDSQNTLVLGSGAAETQLAGNLNISAILNNFNATNDAAAATLGVQPGHVYHTNGVLKVRVS